MSQKVRQITPRSRERLTTLSPTVVTHTQRDICCIGSLSICDSIARTAAFAFADGGRIQRRLARTADPKLYQLKVNISPSTFYVDNNSTPTIVSNLLEAKHSLF
jgi:hypothetical protein